MNNLNIIAECEDYLAVYKPSGMLSQGAGEEGDLIDVLRKHGKKKLHLLSRLDRPVSGLAMVSKNQKFTKDYLSQQETERLTKTYIALVEGQYNMPETEIKHYAYHDKRKHKSVICPQDHKYGQLLESTIKTLALLDNYSVVEIKITKGKFHQIRCQLSAEGHPVKGDVKYGARRKNKNRNIHLHSWKVDFKDLNGASISLLAGLPENDDLWQVVNQKLSSI